MIWSRTGFPNYRQLDKMDCGPTCLRIIAKFYGQDLDLQTLREYSFKDNTGVSLAGIKEAAEKIGLDTFSALISWNDFMTKVPFPCIVHWQDNHFLTVYKATKSRIYISDPSEGKYTLFLQEFRKGWLMGKEEGVVMVLEPTNRLYANSSNAHKTDFHFLAKYLFTHKKILWQLALGLFIASLIQLVFPFLTQGIVDYGIENHDFSFIKVILIAQVFLILCSGFVEILRDWIILHISTRLNLRIMSDYLSKLIKLPVSFFKSRGTGDLVQRINDNSRIEDFLTNGSITFVFDIFNIILFSFVLAYYDLRIFVVFSTGSAIYLIWTTAFMKRKALLDNAYFGSSSQGQSKILQIIQNISEIKLNGSQDRRKKEWHQTQLELFSVNSKNLRVNQIQLNGGRIINEVKNILIIFISANAVIKGSLTLGVMMAIQFIIGHLNVPLNKLVDFLLDFQKARLSAERLLEVHTEKPESSAVDLNEDSIEGNIEFNNVSFGYGSKKERDILRNITITIPSKKVTAIVGASGSGKSTILKLLLQFYQPGKGFIKIGTRKLEQIPIEKWRERCGAVLQDGKLFGDSIERNVTESKSKFPTDKWQYSQAIQAS
ncbi:MAG: cysteine peptidase family C39 domain-containing protein, partial [Draconibacterium sp.]|nr:cysteine peptidase family C39 domain-containing protein [Draconibacterium sp.]